MPLEDLLVCLWYYEIQNAKLKHCKKNNVFFSLSTVRLRDGQNPFTRQCQRSVNQVNSKVVCTEQSESCRFCISLIRLILCMNESNFFICTHSYDGF